MPSRWLWDWRSAPVSRRRSISVTISETEHEAAVLFLSAIHQPLRALSIQIMSQTHPNTSSSSNFQSVLKSTLDACERKTKTKLLTHPVLRLARRHFIGSLRSDPAIRSPSQEQSFPVLESFW